MDSPTRVALLALENSGLVYSMNLDQELEYIFKHALVQEAAYQSILRSDRSLLHGIVADLIEKTNSQNLLEVAGILAYHYSASGNERKAVQYLLMAGEQALSQYAIREALPLLEQAAELARANGWKDELGRALGGMGEIYRLDGETNQAIEVFNQAIENTTSARLRGYFFMQMGLAYHLNLYSFDNSLACFQKAEAELQLEPDPGVLGRLYTHFGYYHAILPALEDESIGLAYFAKGRDLLASTQFHNDLAFNYAYTALSYSFGDPEIGLEWGARCSALCEKYGLIEPYEIGCIAIGHSYRLSRRFEQAVHAYQKGLEINRKTGYLFGKAINLTNLAQALIGLGKYAETLDCLKEAEEYWHKLNNPTRITRIKPARSILLRELGRNAEAERELRESFSYSPEKSRVYYRLMEAYMAMDRQNAALDILREHQAEFSSDFHEYFQTDLVFKPLQENPEFQRLVDEIQ